jgi:signal transduction histidine kinase
MKQRLQRRWMLALAGFTLAVAALFGLFAMAFVYTVEDRFLERLLRQEAERQRAQLAATGRYTATVSDFITLHLDRSTLPADLARQLAQEPRRHEAAGDEGRHYHLLALERRGDPPWLVAEVSQQLIVRPMRAALLRWLAAWGLAAVAVALLLGWWLARRVTRPLETLARRVADADPQQLPAAVARGMGDDEVGAVARAFDALLDRTRAFITREQAFTRDASHELRTPLAVLRLSIERLQADPAAAAAAGATLSAMHASTWLMEQTVQTLLLMAREDEVPAAPAEPVALLPLAEQWLLAHAGWLDQRHASIELALSRHDSLALPAPVLQLAVASLLGNAVSHGMAAGAGPLLIAIRFEAGMLTVSNPGPSLPVGVGADFAKGEHSSGFGLGLAILHRLLAAHGGRLILTHQAGVTTAAVGLSRADAAALRPPAPGPSA